MTFAEISQQITVECYFAVLLSLHWLDNLIFQQTWSQIYLLNLLQPILHTTCRYGRSLDHWDWWYFHHVDGTAETLGLALDESWEDCFFVIVDYFIERGVAEAGLQGIFHPLEFLISFYLMCNDEVMWYVLVGSHEHPPKVFFKIELPFFGYSLPVFWGLQHLQFLDVPVGIIEGIIWIWCVYIVVSKTWVNKFEFFLANIDGRFLLFEAAGGDFSFNFAFEFLYCFWQSVQIAGVLWQGAILNKLVEGNCKSLGDEGLNIAGISFDLVEHFEQPFGVL